MVFFHSVVFFTSFFFVSVFYHVLFIFLMSCVRLSWLLSASERTLNRSISNHTYIASCLLGGGGVAVRNSQPK